MNKQKTNGETEPALQENDEINLSLRRLFESAREKDQSAISEILNKYARTISSIVRAYDGRFPPNVDEDQLSAAAEDALFDCILKVDLARLGEFQKYISSAIRKKFNDLARKCSCNTRTQWENLAEFNEARIQLSNRLGREASMEEVYSELEWDETKKKNHFIHGSPTLERLDPLLDDSSGSTTFPAKLELPLSETNGDLKQLSDEIANLPEDEQQLIRRRYLVMKPPSQKKYAREMGITEHRVRQIEKSALARLTSVNAE